MASSAMVLAVQNEKGLMCRWAAAKPSFGAVLYMFDDVAACVATVHAAGRVHRDLKPVRSIPSCLQQAAYPPKDGHTRCML